MGNVALIRTVTSMAVTNIVTRVAHAADVPVIEDLYERENLRASAPTLPSTIERYPAVVAYDGEELVGFALTTRIGPDVLELRYILVAPNQRSSGIGTQMLNELERTAAPKWKGVVAVNSMGYAGKANGRLANGFFRRLGFRQVLDTGTSLLFVKELIDVTAVLAPIVHRPPKASPRLPKFAPPPPTGPGEFSRPGAPPAPEQIEASDEVLLAPPDEPNALRDLESLRATRSSAATSLAAALLHDRATTEAELADAWVKRMRTSGIDWFWYAPPPDGTTVLSGYGDPTRLALQSFRAAPAWPSRRPLDPASPASFYTSPVSPSGIVGDFGMTTYAGADAEIQRHISCVADLVAEIADIANPGVRYRDLYLDAKRTWEAARLHNDVTSDTDQAGTNIGHTIPFFGAERPALAAGEEGSRTLSQERSFVSERNETEIAETCAFTIEPRLGAPGLPVVWFHVIVVFIDGTKHVITEFDPVVEATGATWFTNPWHERSL
jgi:N-acetylglutamate synthase-like GNAT family acetyltransferase